MRASLRGNYRVTGAQGKHHEFPLLVMVFPVAKKVKTISKNSEFRHPLANNRSYKTRNGRVEEIREARGSRIGIEVLLGSKMISHTATGVVHALHSVYRTSRKPLPPQVSKWRRGAA
jgi:hypothetical protein